MVARKRRTPVGQHALESTCRHVRLDEITGAGRGMGVNFAKAALTAGHKVVATGRETDRVSKALGQSHDLLVVAMDVTKPSEVEAAVRAAVDRFGRVEVLVNNAANFYAGYFEELAQEQMDRQLATSLIGPMNVTRAVLPEQSMTFAEQALDDYSERRAKQLEFWRSQNGKQGGDPRKLARALVSIAEQKVPPQRFLAGTDSIESTERKITFLQKQIAALRELSDSLAFDDAASKSNGS